MEKKTFWVIAGIAIAILLILVIWQTIQINAVSANAATTAASAVKTAGAAASSSGMVGGC